MQVQLTTDYAMRIIAYMLSCDALDKNNLVQAAKMANEIGVDYQYSMKVINQLKKADIIKSVQGCSGGYHLNGRLADLSFYDIIKTMEGEICLIKCLHADKCSRKSQTECPLKCEFNKLQDTIVNMLKQIKIKEICTSEF